MFCKIEMIEQPLLHTTHICTHDYISTIIIHFIQANLYFGVGVQREWTASSTSRARAVG
jgi:hypothetical protein